MVGTGGFEPPTSRTPSVRATKLRYVPILDTRWANAVSLPSLRGEMVFNSLSPAPVEFVSNNGGSEAAIPASVALFYTKLIPTSVTKSSDSLRQRRRLL